MLRIYQETDRIKLPAEFAADMDIQKDNAGIGDPDRVESNYTLE